MIRFGAFLLTIAFAIAVLGGCGGGGGSGSSSGDSTVQSTGGSEAVGTSSLDKAEFVKQADEICAEESELFLKSITNYMAKHPPQAGESEQEVAADGVRQTLLPKFQNQIDRVRELGAPAGEEEEVEAILEAMQHAVDSLAQRNEVALATDIDKEFKPAGKLAVQYGLENCAH